MKYKSGTLICWGAVITPTGVGQGAANTVTLPKAYANTSYAITCAWEMINAGSGRREIIENSVSTTNFKWRVVSGAGNYNLQLRSFRWMTIGQGA